MLAIKKRVFQTVKSLIPKISATEMIALQSGTKQFVTFNEETAADVTPFYVEHFCFFILMLLH